MKSLRIRNGWIHDGIHPERYQAITINPVRQSKLTLAGNGGSQILEKRLEGWELSADGKNR